MQYAHERSNDKKCSVLTWIEQNEKTLFSIINEIVLRIWYIELKSEQGLLISSGKIFVLCMTLFYIGWLVLFLTPPPNTTNIIYLGTTYIMIPKK